MRIRAVQKVIHNPTQLSGRGFSHIFYTRSILSQSYVLLMLQNGRRADKTCFIMLHNACFPFRTTLPHALTPPERCASPSEYDTSFLFSSVVLSPRPSYARFRSKTFQIPKVQSVVFSCFLLYFENMKLRVLFGKCECLFFGNSDSLR